MKVIIIQADTLTEAMEKKGEEVVMTEDELFEFLNKIKYYVQTEQQTPRNRSFR